MKNDAMPYIGPWPCPTCGAHAGPLSVAYEKIYGLKGADPAVILGKKVDCNPPDPNSVEAAMQAITDALKPFTLDTCKTALLRGHTALCGVIGGSSITSGSAQ